ncbi:toll-like receptor 13 [Archocentrus centrarchus]|uniref:toll-like receptor 13 n=1 Tax=Archocentrus centrarchus TaxID=63155 RepID=UPI0011EA46F5|nr:toll-like receptor 13 [Archocentrus centrarchus]
MLATGSWSLLLIALLTCLCCYNLSLAFTLKNCRILYTENANTMSVECAGRDLIAIPDDIPRNATSLNFTSNKVSNITGKDLRGLSKLKVVHAQNNLISHIDDGAFADLVELQKLILDKNNLSKVTENMFQGLYKLVDLSLNNNQISSISPVAFRSLVSLGKVSLSSNFLHQIADIAPILTLPHLEYLSIGRNAFTSFQSSDLPLNSSNLLRLDLMWCQLKKFNITKDIFPQLNLLDLRRCNTSIEWNVANKTFMRSLTSLYLDGNHVTFKAYSAMLQTTDSLKMLKLYFMDKSIKHGIIDIACQIPSLRILDVGNSKIPTIKDTLLKSCSQLTQLRLPYNKMVKMSDRALLSMTQLKNLDLQKNVLSKVPIALRGLSTLEVLDLSFNIISELNSCDFNHLTRLTHLNLTHNRISQITQPVFQKLSQLEVLTLETNEIFSFYNTFMGKFSKLKRLYLNNNSFKTLQKGDFRSMDSLDHLELTSDSSYIDHSGIFEGLKNLYTLKVSCKGYVKEYFRGLSNLNTLIFHITTSQNIQHHALPFSYLTKLKKLDIIDHREHHEAIPPDVLNGLTSLEQLMMQNFFVGSLHPDTFKYTPQLKVLKIVHSGISNLTSEVFWPVPNLTMLDLSNNKLMSLDFLADAKLPVLRWLKLSNNALQLIKENVLNSLPALTYLDLASNRLTCECSSSDFNKWIQSDNHTQVVNAHQYTCAYPVSQQGKRFLDFDVNSCRIDASFLCFISSFCLTVLTLLTSFIYHFLRWHLTYAYYLFLAFLYDNKRKKGSPHSYDAFVSYNVHDEAWVYGELLPVLEGQQGWRLCLHHRDFEPGKPIIENITDAIYNSRKTICVISQHYLQSEWCSREIQMASYRLFNEHKDVLVMVFLEDIPARHLTPYYQIRSLVKKRTYLSWPQAAQHAGVFWQKIQQALKRAENPTDHRQLHTGHPIVTQ